MAAKTPQASIRKILLAILIASLFIVPINIQYVRAAGVVGTGTPGSCNETALNNALAGGGLVTFNCGGAKTITLTSTKTISTDTTIQGGNLITLDGGSSVRVFIVQSNRTLTLQDITVTHGKAQYGAGLYNSGGKVNLIHSTFTDNQADCTGSGCTWKGGAIYNADSSWLDITDSTIHNNTGDLMNDFSVGGAIYNEGSVTINHSLFSANTAEEGGGIYNAYGTVLVTGVSTFTTNLAYTNNIIIYPKGGAIVNLDHLTVDQATFSGNHASHGAGNYGYGGAIYNTSHLSVSNSNFIDNYAASMGGIGGAIWARGNSTISSSDFSGNYLGAGANRYGGAIYFQSGTHSVEDCSFTGKADGSKTADYGGAIANDESSLTISDSEFNENVATYGGGVYNKYPGTLTVSDSTFHGNQASYGGGGLFNSNIAEVSDCTFSENEAVNTGDALGGGIYTGGTMTVTLTTFEENAATSTSTGSPSGGGIYSLFSTLLIQESSFYSNTVDIASTTSAVDIKNWEMGSAIHAGGTMTVTGSAFYHNDAREGYGTVYLESGDYVINNSTFYSNTVGAEGSAVYKRTLANLFIKHNTIAFNEGTALSNEYFTNPITLTNSIISNNQKNCNWPVNNNGGNLQFGGSVSDSCGASIDDTQDPQLDSLADYGGPTLSMRLQSGSPAINYAAANCLPFDQRGFTRSAAPCDAGAYEVKGSGVSLTSSANPALPWQQVTFTASVEEGDAPTPTGTITFKDNGVLLDTVSVGGSGVATYQVIWRENGDHPITAEYSGDANFNPSQSSTLEQEVYGLVIFLPVVTKN